MQGVGGSRQGTNSSGVIAMVGTSLGAGKFARAARVGWTAAGLASRHRVHRVVRRRGRRFGAALGRLVSTDGHGPRPVERESAKRPLRLWWCPCRILGAGHSHPI
jgi:hypothetical protein